MVHILNNDIIEWIHIFVFILWLVLIVASDWLKTMKDRHLFHFCRNQVDISHCDVIADVTVEIVVAGRLPWRADMIEWHHCISMVFYSELKHRHCVNNCAVAEGHISNGLKILIGSQRIWNPGPLARWRPTRLPLCRLDRRTLDNNPNLL